MTDDPYEHQQRQMGYFSRELLDKGKKPSDILTDSVCRFIKDDGGAARRISYGYRTTKTGKKFAVGMKPGIEDVTAIMRVVLPRGTIGQMVACEVKYGRDTMGDDQWERKAEVEAAGGIYLIVKDIEVFKKEWNDHKQKIIKNFTT